jgi:hypothetical protein
MYFNGLFNIDGWNREASYIILDDINIKFFPHWKCFIGCQREFVLTDKYRGKQTLKWGKPCIWIGNDDPRDDLSISERDYFSINCHIVIITNKLY